MEDSSSKRKLEKETSLFDVLRFDNVCSNITNRLPNDSLLNLSSSCKKLQKNRFSCILFGKLFDGEKFQSEYTHINHILSEYKVCTRILDKLPLESVYDLMSAYPHLSKNEFVHTYLETRLLSQPSTKMSREKLFSAIPFSSRLSTIFEDKIMHQILSYLPVKILCKFKCVSKSWELLHSNSSFVQLHLHQSKTSPQILIATAEQGSILIYSPKPGSQGGEVILKAKTSWKETGLLEPINGLFCFYSTSEYSVRIYNISTRQDAQSFFTSLPIQPRGTSIIPSYGFGFDPLTCKYKVICVWEISRDLPHYRHGMMSGNVEYICEVLTVGENQWKRIDEVPPVTLCGQPVYANGSLYWRNLGNSYSKRPDKELIVAFDVGLEKFRVIEIPDFIIDTFRESTLKRAENLLEVNGHIALIDRANGNLMNLWTSDDSPNARSTSWEEEKIELPFWWEEGHYLSVNGIEGKNELVLEDPILSDASDSINFWIYNRGKKSFRKVGINGIYPMLKSPFIYAMFVFHESLLTH